MGILASTVANFSGFAGKPLSPADFMPTQKESVGKSRPLRMTDEQMNAHFLKFKAQFENKPLPEVNK